MEISGDNERGLKSTAISNGNSFLAQEARNFSKELLFGGGNDDSEENIRAIRELLLDTESLEILEEETESMSKELACIVIQSHFRKYLARKRARELLFGYDHFLGERATEAKSAMIRSWIQEAMENGVEYVDAPEIFKRRFLNLEHNAREKAKREFEPETVQDSPTILKMREILSRKSKYPVMENAALQIQCWFRTCLCRSIAKASKDMLQEERRQRAVIVIQSWFRCLRTRNIARALYEEKPSEKRQHSGIQTQKASSEISKAAVIIQRTFRRYLARTAALNIPQDGYYKFFEDIIDDGGTGVQLEKEVAVLRIQSWYRGRKAREIARKELAVEPSLFSQRSVSSFEYGKESQFEVKSKLISMDVLSMEEKSAHKIQAWFRSLTARNFAKKLVHSDMDSLMSLSRSSFSEEDAVLIIQSWYRNLIARRIARSIKHLPRNDAKPNDQDLVNTVLFLQARIRGAFARKFALILPEYSEIISSISSFSGENNLYVDIDRENAALAIQAWFRGRLAAKKAREISENLPKEPILIERLLEAYSPSSTSTSRYIGSDEREIGMLETEQDVAARIIQSWFRGYLARKASIDMFRTPSMIVSAVSSSLSRESAVLMIQAAYRGRKARKTAMALNHTFIPRKDMETRKFINVERIKEWSNELVRTVEVSADIDEDFKRAYNRMMKEIRNDMSFKVKGQIELEYESRRSRIIARKKKIVNMGRYPIMNGACIKIQAWFRSMRCRSLANSVGGIQEVRKLTHGVLGNISLVSCAIRIQSWYRSVFARKYAASLIESG